MTHRIDVLNLFGFHKEGTGGGCTAFVRRLPNKVAIYLTDGDLNAPEEMDDPAQLSIYDADEECIDNHIGTFNSVEAVIDYLTLTATRDAIDILGHPDITSEILHYALDSSRGEFRGFAALHDQLDANMLLPGAEEGKFDLLRAEAAIAAFNDLVAPINSKPKLYTPPLPPMPEISNKTFGALDADLRQVYNGLEDCGFRHPATRYYKPDPRGGEYGYFEVAVADSDNIKVTHYLDGNRYEMVFRDIGNFKAWAKVNT